MKNKMTTIKFWLKKKLKIYVLIIFKKYKTKDLINLKHRGLVKNEFLLFIILLKLNYIFCLKIIEIQNL